MKKELLEDARKKLAEARDTLENASVELDGYELKIVTYMIEQTRDNIEVIDRMIRRTRSEV